jgi:hypothetical protein
MKSYDVLPFIFKFIIYVFQLTFFENKMFEETSDPKPKESTIFDALKCSNLPEETLSRVEDTQQILDLEKHVKSMKRQEITAMEKAKRSAELEAKISCLEAQVSSLSAKITELTDSDR